MNDTQKSFARRLSLVIGALALLIPVTVSPSQGIEGNEACANGTCCREMLSVCSADGSSTTHYYNSIDGVCTAVRAE